MPHLKVKAAETEIDRLHSTLTCQLAWSTLQMGFVRGQGFDRTRDPARLPGFPGTPSGAARGPRSLQWGIHGTDPRCWHTAAPSAWWSACEPAGAGAFGSNIS